MIIKRGRYPHNRARGIGGAWGETASEKNPTKKIPIFYFILFSVLWPLCVRNESIGARLWDL